MCQTFILSIVGLLGVVVVGCVLILIPFHFQGNKPIKIHVGGGGYSRYRVLIFGVV